jgi:hypothetical protein
LESFKPPTLDEMVTAADEVFADRPLEPRAVAGQETDRGRRKRQAAETTPARTETMPRKHATAGPPRRRHQPPPSRSPASIADEALEENVEQSSSVLLKPRKGGVTRDGLFAACLEPLVEALGATCLWSKHGRDWKVGDYRCLVLSTTVGQEPVSVNWWSEPLEAVRAGVTWGGVPDATREYFQGDARQVLERLRYERDDDLGWHFKNLSLRAKAQVQRASREALTIVSDVFGYRGRAPLYLTTGHGTRTEPQDVYPFLTPQDLLKLLTLFGCDVRLHRADGGTPPFCEVRERQGRYVVILDWPAPGNRYASLRFAMPVKERTPLPLPALNRINDRVRFVTLSRGHDADLCLAMDVRIAGGVTAVYLRHCLADWDGARREVRRMMRAADRVVTTSTRKARPRRGQSR